MRQTDSRSIFFSARAGPHSGKEGCQPGFLRRGGWDVQGHYLPFFVNFTNANDKFSNKKGVTLLVVSITELYPICVTSNKDGQYKRVIYM